MMITKYIYILYILYKICLGERDTGGGITGRSVYNLAILNVFNSCRPMQIVINRRNTSRIYRFLHILATMTGSRMRCQEGHQLKCANSGVGWVDLFFYVEECSTFSPIFFL